MTSISTAGGNTINIYSSYGTLYYNVNGGSASTITWPVTVTNSNTSAGVVKVLFGTDITLNNTNCYFTCGSDKIQFGSQSLNADGSRRTLTVTVDNYDGLISNGASGVNGKNSIYVYNLVIDGTGHTTQIGAGWLGKKFFGLGTTNNYIINCSSKGAIYGGGMLGDSSAKVTLLGCSSSGDIGDNAGGIVGQYVDTVTLQYCYSTGAISGNGAGGIVGSTSTSADVSNCYSEGAISGDNAGGIMGSNAGSSSVTITKCYSRGAITGNNAGGICGSLGAVDVVFSVTITNCYSTGNVSGGTANGAICGLLLAVGSGIVSLTITNCYTSGTCGATGYIIGNRTTITGIGASPYLFALSSNYSEAGSVGGVTGTWSNTHANTVLTGISTGTPGVGTTWVSVTNNAAYELNNFGYTPYSTTNIVGNALVQTASQSISVGEATQAGLVSAANSYSILQFSGGNSQSYNTITINPTTGVISTRPDILAGTYTITVRKTGSYFITTFVLTVSADASSTTAACCASTIDERGIDYAQIADYKIGNRLILEHQQNSNLKFDGYSQYNKYKMAQRSRKY